MTSFSTKPVLAQGLAPLLRILGSLRGRWSSFWAYARLHAQVLGLDASTVVLGMPELHGTRRLRLGRNLYLYRDLHLETQGSGEIRIGNDVVLSRGVHLVAFERIEIGDGSMIGEYSNVRDANHSHGADIELRQSGHAAAAIHIGRNVWIGRGVTILPGVRIGDGAVIGANAVVMRDIPAQAVAVGVPARVLICEEGT